MNLKLSRMLMLGVLMVALVAPSAAMAGKDTLTVAVDSKGTSVHQTGPAEWRVKIEDMM